MKYLKYLFVKYKIFIQKLIFIQTLTLFLLSNINAKNYYVSDANLSPNYQRHGTIGDPWNTRSDVAAFLGSITNGPQGGDSILFQRGAQWNGRYLIN